MNSNLTSIQDFLETLSSNSIKSEKRNDLLGKISNLLLKLLKVKVFTSKKAEFPRLKDEDLSKVIKKAQKIVDLVGSELDIGWSYHYNFRERSIIVRELNTNGIETLCMPLNRKGEMEKWYDDFRKGEHDYRDEIKIIRNNNLEEMVFDLEFKEKNGHAWYIVLFPYLLKPIKIKRLPNIYERESMPEKYVEKYVRTIEEQKEVDRLEELERRKKLESFDEVKISEIDVGDVLKLGDFAIYLGFGVEKKQYYDVHWYEEKDYTFSEEYYKVTKINPKSIRIEGILSKQQGRLSKEDKLRPKEVIVKRLDDEQLEVLNEHIKIWKAKKQPKNLSFFTFLRKGIGLELDFVRIKKGTYVCPFCEVELDIKEVAFEYSYLGTKVKYMYSCPKCRSILGFSN